ncbi:MAG: hypothetical protein ACTTKW_07095 [Schwartzia sp. (in: firmicutes)]
MSLGDAAFTREKKRVKTIRTIIQIFCLMGIVYLLVDAFFSLTTYRPFEGYSGSEGVDTGFVALSYFGVERKGDKNSLIGAPLLREHLKALRQQGYVTITQQDVEAYYAEGKPLPPRALFLMFEDGRRDTAIFAQPILEELNFLGNMMTYAENFVRKDLTFLHPDELLELEKSSYWQLGTNGYRLQFINVFDRYDNYIGEIDPLRFSMMKPALSRRYNHYLMDFIRDKYGVPKESVNRMHYRIGYDYERLEELYREGIGYVPGLYVIMHANTGAYGNHPLVSQTNGQWIHKLFRMNFNREGYSFNQRNSSIYDLTRMQPQPDWSVNHLLMRIKYDINQPVDFVVGDAVRHGDWEIVKGAAEMKGEEYILTSLPEDSGLSRLRSSGSFSDVHLQVELRGNRYGEQGIYLRANDDLSRFIRFRLGNGVVSVVEKVDGRERELYREKLSTLFGIAPLSVDEARRDAEVLELQTFARYADSSAQANEYAARALQRQQESALSVADGGAVYEETTDRNVRSFQKLNLSLVGDTLSIRVGGAEVPAITVGDTAAGSLFLEAGWSDEAQWSQRNLADDVYDGRFYKLTVSADPAGETILYSTEYTGWPKVKARAAELWNGVLNWFIDVL